MAIIVEAVLEFVVRDVVGAPAGRESNPHDAFGQ